MTSPGNGDMGATPLHSPSWMTIRPTGPEALGDEELAELVKDLAARSRRKTPLADVAAPDGMIEAGAAESRSEPSWPPSLDPVVMPPPPPVRRTYLPDLTIVAKMIGAFGVTATLGLVVLNLMQLPAMTSGTVTIEQPQATSPALQSFARIAPADAREASAEPRGGVNQRAFESFNALPSPVRAPAPEPQAESPVTSQPRSRGALAVQSGTVAPTATARSEDNKALLRRGQALIAAGDIASARLILTRLAEMGVADASYAMAQTYDFAVLSKLNVIGIQPDASRANAWYAKAAAQGSAEAQRQMQQSANR